jgi:hypothetical protein
MDQKQLMSSQEYYGGGNYVKAYNKDDNFLQWFLENKKGIENLKFIWRGWERDIYGRWVKMNDSESKRIMNERGIHWATSVMENYLDRVFQSTNWNDEHMNFEMRKAYRVVWFGIMTQYIQFGLTKVNSQGVATQILSRIHAMLLAARGDGIKRFIGTTQQITEQRLINDQQKRGIFSSIAGVFKRRPDQQY